MSGLKPPREPRLDRDRGWYREPHEGGFTVWRLWRFTNDGGLAMIDVAVTDYELKLSNGFFAAMKLREARYKLKQLVSQVHNFDKE